MTQPTPPPDTARMDAILDFLSQAQALKDTLRSGRTHNGDRESAAAHSWGLCLLAVLVERDLGPVDMVKLLKLCIVHDLGEAISGDIPAPLQDPAQDKTAQERADFATLTAQLPRDLRDDMRALWEEYTLGTSPEAQLGKGLDKIETMMQHVTGEQVAGFDYLWNLGYGRAQTNLHPFVQRLRSRVDLRTQATAAARQDL